MFYLKPNTKFNIYVGVATHFYETSTSYFAFLTSALIHYPNHAPNM
jgi:hypothetical protein